MRGQTGELRFQDVPSESLVERTHVLCPLLDRRLGRWLREPRGPGVGICKGQSKGEVGGSHQKGSEAEAPSEGGRALAGVKEPGTWLGDPQQVLQLWV